MSQRWGIWLEELMIPHLEGFRYCSRVRGLGPPNQSIKNILSMSSLKIWKLWSLGQSGSRRKF